MNHYEAIIKSSQQIETFLECSFNAEGKGPIEKARNVRNVLSQEVFQNILEFGRIRNQFVHEVGFKIDDYTEIASLTDRIFSGLQRTVENNKKTPLQREQEKTKQIFKKEKDEWDNYSMTSALSVERMYKFVPIGLGAFAMLYWIFFM